MEKPYEKQDHYFLVKQSRPFKGKRHKENPAFSRSRAGCSPHRDVSSPRGSRSGPLQELFYDSFARCCELSPKCIWAGNGQFLGASREPARGGVRSKAKYRLRLVYHSGAK